MRQLLDVVHQAVGLTLRIQFLPSSEREAAGPNLLTSVAEGAKGAKVEEVKWMGTGLVARRHYLPWRVFCCRYPHASPGTAYLAARVEELQDHLKIAPPDIRPTHLRLRNA